MSYKKNIHLLAVLIMFIACNNPKSPSDTKDGSNENSTDSLSAKMLDQLAILRNVFNREPTDSAIDDIGREVAMDSALLCIGVYEGQMYKHGIEVDAGVNRNLGTIPTRKITKSEDFAGHLLIEWIEKMVKLLDPEGRGVNMGFQLHLGIYTDEFLNTYLAGRPAEAIQRKKNRITIFIIPYRRGTYQLKNADGKTAYELGGIQP